MSGVAGSGNKTKCCKTFRASGTATGWASSVKAVYCRAIAGGGGGGAPGNNGGQAGQYFEGWLDVGGITSAAVVIGAGGTSPSGSGGNTTFNGIALCRGGRASDGPASYGAAGMGFFYDRPVNTGVINGAGRPEVEGAANSGAGGGSNAAGGSGYLELTWEE